MSSAVSSPLLAKLFFMSLSNLALFSRTYFCCISVGFVRGSCTSAVDSLSLSLKVNQHTAMLPMITSTPTTPKIIK